MKLFHFNPNGYGEEAFVMAKDKEAAIQAVKKTKADAHDSKSVREYHAHMINDMINSTGGYTIEEYPVGHVIFSEIC